MQAPQEHGRPPPAPRTRAGHMQAACGGQLRAACAYAAPASTARFPIRRSCVTAWYQQFEIGQLTVAAVVNPWFARYHAECEPPRPCYHQQTGVRQRPALGTVRNRSTFLCAAQCAANQPAQPWNPLPNPDSLGAHHGEVETSGPHEGPSKVTLCAVLCSKESSDPNKTLPSPLTPDRVLLEGARRGEVIAGHAGERGPVQDLQHGALRREAQLRQQLGREQEALRRAGLARGLA